MRPLRLDAEGFGTFRDRVSLDFSDTDYFALVGPTGSGKTTVIDAICFALYGSAPRWPRRNQVSLAMAPSTSHTRVSLIFDISGRRYAAVRALARSARGQVTTKQCRLIALPVELDLAGELGDLLDAELESLAEAPAAMDEAVQQLLGLSYEHFTQSVVLPQGRFAKFLHAEKRDRQDLLVSLLGLGMYERVKQRANAMAEESRTRAATLSGELIKYADATESAERLAAERLEILTTLQADLADLLAPWKTSASELAASATATVGHENNLQLLAGVTAPPGLHTLLAEREAAQSSRTEWAKKVAKAEEAEIAAEEAVQGAGRPGDWQELLKNHGRLDQLSAQQVAAGNAVATSAEAAKAATERLERARAAREQARLTQDRIRIAHQADDLAASLVAGAECPVCLQVVNHVRDRPQHRGIAEAQAAVERAEQASTEAAAVQMTAHRALDRATDAADRLADQLKDTIALVQDQPDAATASTRHETALQAEQAFVDARRTARTSRESRDKADAAARMLDERWIAAGRTLSLTRDRVAHLTPPSTSGDHAQDWTSLMAWATREVEELTTQAAEAIARRRDAEIEEEQQRSEVIATLEHHGVAVSGAFSETTVVAAAATSASSADSQLKRVRERRAESAQLEQDIHDQRTSEALHRELGNLLSARNFERWMVEEALQAMMIDASISLSELSGGQFELTLDDTQDILVIDHNDASSQRPVQTLSGGETFQASLALALALSSQIAELSPSAGQLDTLLLDEGFGTLDPSTLDVVAGTLEQLASGGERTVGLVTHVAALAERVPVRFEVRREGSRSLVQKVWA